MINFFKQLLDFIYERKCYICKKSSKDFSVCPKCYKKLVEEELNKSWNIEIKNQVPFYFAGYYANNLQKLIRGLKYHNQEELAGIVAQFMFEYWEKFEHEKDHYVIIPTPLHINRLRKRGYNHMELVGKELANLTGYEINTNLLTRIKDTVPQYGLKYYERMENMNGAFEVNQNAYNGESLILIDDILTTGSTIQEMVKTLNATGIDDITVFTLTAHLSRK